MDGRRCPKARRYRRFPWYVWDIVSGPLGENMLLWKLLFSCTQHCGNASLKIFIPKILFSPFFPRVHFPSPLDISRYWLENRFSSHSLTVSLFFEKTITQCYLPIPCSPIRLITSNFSTHNAVLFFNILFDNYPPKNPTCLNRTE